jgi:putative sensor protein
MSERIRRVTRDCLRGLAQAFAALVFGVPLFVLSVVSVALIPVGVGLVLVPLAVAGVRAFADLQRRWAGEWAGVEIPVPYRAVPRSASSSPRTTTAGCWPCSPTST